MIHIQTKSSRSPSSLRQPYTLFRATCLRCGTWDGTWFRKPETARIEGRLHVLDAHSNKPDPRPVGGAP